MKPIVVNVATKEYRAGQDRLKEALDRSGESGWYWSYIPGITKDAEGNVLSYGWPQHDQIPYAFKAMAMQAAADKGFDTLLWCDSSIVLVDGLAPLWARIDRDGYWISRNATEFSNYEWTAESAYPDLFPEFLHYTRPGAPFDIEAAKEQNKEIQHASGTAFGISTKHEIGRRFLAEFYRLATTTTAFCGPWINTNWVRTEMPDVLTMEAGSRIAPCGPAGVRGHRHDQTAISVLAWKLGMKLTIPPHVFAYEGQQTDDTILLAKGI